MLLAFKETRHPYNFWVHIGYTQLENSLDSNRYHKRSISWYVLALMFWVKPTHLLFFLQWKKYGQSRKQEWVELAIPIDKCLTQVLLHWRKLQIFLPACWPVWIYLGKSHLVSIHSNTFSLGTARAAGEHRTLMSMLKASLSIYPWALTAETSC